MRRSGLATVWLIMSMPVLLAALCLTIDIGKLWVERAALENAVEAAALAAVRYWRVHGPVLHDPIYLQRVREEAFAFAEANVVDGKALKLDDALGASVTIEFGRIENGTFRPNVLPSDSLYPAVRVTVRNYPISSACGMAWPYNVNVSAIAFFATFRAGSLLHASAPGP